jgi:hypothetical protein
MNKFRSELRHFSRAAKKQSRLSQKWIKQLEIVDFQDKKFLAKVAKRLHQAADNWQTAADEFAKKALVSRSIVVPASDTHV